MTNTSAPANPALSTLKDIQLPADIGFWPLAPGIWALILLLLLAMVALCCWAVRRYRQRRRQQAASQDALQLLSTLELDDPQLPLQVSTLLKRTAVSYGDREAVAALTGTAWYAYLDQVLPQAQQGQFAQLLEQRYQRPATDATTNQQLLRLCQQWIQRAPHFYQNREKQPC